MANDTHDPDWEELYGPWEPSIVAAHVVDEQKFAIAVGGPRFDDPFTVVLTFDQSQDQPWSRFEMRREITSLRGVGVGERDSGDEIYAALSLSGDIYYIGSEIERITIPGTETENPSGKASALYSFAWTGGEVLVGGAFGVLLSGKGRNWRSVSPQISLDYPYGEPVWYILGQDSSGAVYLYARQEPNPRHFMLYPGHPLFRPQMPEVEKRETEKRLEDEEDEYRAKGPRRRLFVGTPANWIEVTLPRVPALSASHNGGITGLHFDGPDDVWLVGNDGLILRGSPEKGFSDVSFKGDRGKQLSGVVRFQQQILVWADSELLVFNGHLLLPFKPKVKIQKPPFVVQPSSVQIYGKRLFLFDYQNRIHRFDGESWEEIVIPPELLEREFKGLPPGK
jgi:hypothetical protein